jgi:proteasome lid subunit RPN8/RPN11
MNVKNKIIKHAKREVPNECCGFIIQKEKELDVFECINSSVSKNEHFKISPKQYLEATALGTITSVYHSHVNDNIEFSHFDKTQSEAQNIRYLMYHIGSNSFVEYVPTGKKDDLLGRSHIVGVSDCLTLVRDYYRTRHGVNIKDYERNESFDYGGEDLFRENYESEGFFEIEKSELREGDAILINKFGESFLSHSAVYMGNDTILHHPAGGFSCIEEYSRALKERTLLAVRHNFLR